jgi:hypothetical protein
MLILDETGIGTSPPDVTSLDVTCSRPVQFFAAYTSFQFRLAKTGPDEDSEK